MIPLVLSVLAVMFTDEERTRAVGVWAAANFLALPIGPILGGWLLTNYWWGWVFLMNVPVVVIGLVAVTVLVPESRAASAPGLDLVGIVASCAGLAVLIYGFIAAGQYGWSSATAISAMAGGAAVLAAFAALGTAPHPAPRRAAAGGSRAVPVAPGSPGEPSCRRSASSRCSACCSRRRSSSRPSSGVNAMGSGMRLLPLMAGLALGAALANQVARRLTAKLTAALGFAILTAGLVLGATMTAASGDAFIATWTAITGLGFGLALATAASAALVDMPKESAGVGSAVMQAVQKAGAPLSAAVLGSVLAVGLPLPAAPGGLPAATAGAVRSSVFAGIAVARKLGSPALLDSVRSAFVHGIDPMLWVSAGLAVAGVVLALLFLPWRATAARRPSAGYRRGSRKEQNRRMSALPEHTPAPAPGPARPGAATAGAARAQEGQDACCHPGARVPAVPRAGLRRHHGRADRRRRRGLAEHVLPLLPDQGRRRPPGRHGAALDGGLPGPAARHGPRSPPCGPGSTPPSPAWGRTNGRRLRETTELAMTVPAVRARMLDGTRQDHPGPRRRRWPSGRGRPRRLRGPHARRCRRGGRHVRLVRSARGPGRVRRQARAGPGAAGGWPAAVTRARAAAAAWSPSFPRPPGIPGSARRRGRSRSCGRLSAPARCPGFRRATALRGPVEPGEQLLLVIRRGCRCPCRGPR